MHKLPTDSLLQCNMTVSSPLSNSHCSLLNLSEQSLLYVSIGSSFPNSYQNGPQLRLHHARGALAYISKLLPEWSSAPLTSF